MHAQMWAYILGTDFFCEVQIRDTFQSCTSLQEQAVADSTISVATLGL